MQIELPKKIDLDTIPDIIKEVDQILANPSGDVLTLDFFQVAHLDTSGLGTLVRSMERCQAAQIKVEFVNVDPKLSHLLEFVNIKDAVDAIPGPPPKKRGFFEKLGRNTTWYLKDSLGFFEFLGKATTELLKELVRPYKIRWADTFYYIEATGVNALPIVGLISLLLGMIIAFQSADQLKQFGANIFVVELVAISMLRELSPLITSILIAGRSGSAFTAEIGTMKVSEEVDAMRVIGLDLTEYLVAPKFWALLISLPLLVVWADVLGLVGGALIANWKLDIPYYTFILRLHEKVAVRHLLLGLGKCYFFAAIISIVGCYRGMLVASGAGSVGRQTTSSVVTSIFLVIIADAIFSIIFTLLDV
ncbi:MAG: MlaE family lipid ABC transporter permease subunit [SAR324 cluster bacterium]|nr:MlaE family lipid ABC transporter permease subunit [SAR324 cluster bacterium]